MRKLNKGGEMNMHENEQTLVGQASVEKETRAKTFEEQLKERYREFVEKQGPTRVESGDLRALRDTNL